MSLFPTWQENKPFSLVLLVFFVFLTVFVWIKTDEAIRQAAQIGKPTPVEHTLAVEGEGKASAAPNIATVMFGVQTKADTAAAAQTQNTAVANALLDKVKALGIDPKDIQTSNYASYQSMTWDPTQKKSVPDGWIVSQQVAVKVRDTSKVPSLLQTLGQNGATDISGPAFALEDKTAVLDDARQKAIADAETRAKSLEQSLGVRFERIVGYSETEQNPGPVPYASLAMGVGGGAPAPQVQTGSEEVDLHVTLTYKIAE